MTSPSTVPAVTSSVDGEEETPPSTSLVRFVGTIRARLAPIIQEAKDNWAQNLEELQERLLPENFSVRYSIALPIFGEARLAKWDEGIERLKDIYRLDNSLEWSIIKAALFASFGVGYVFGGATTFAESVRRFEVYTAGKVYFDRPHNQLRSRRLNYALLRFNARGCKVGLKMAFGVLSIVALFLVPVTFFHHFSLLNLPFSTIPVIVFGASSTLRGWSTAGWHACVPPTIFVNAVPLVLILCYCLYHRCTPNEAYWRFKADTEQELRVDAEYARELKAYARYRQKGNYFERMPWARTQMEHERKIGTWKWTSSVEDGLVHLDGTEKSANEADTDATDRTAGDDELDEEGHQIVKALEDKRRGPWWRRLFA